MNPADDLPAILGGLPVRSDGPPPWPIADDVVRLALEAAWRDGAWGRYDGGLVARVEDQLREYHGVPHALTCGSGTFAVELALRALKVGPSDEVVLGAYDYPGNFLSVHATGAMPVLADVDPDNACLTTGHLLPALSPLTKAVIVSHLHGGLAPMRELTELCGARGVPVVEDACQCPGAWVQGRRAGTWGEAGVLSFGGSKVLTAGRGGALLTRHAEVHQRARLVLTRAGNLVHPLSELQAAVLLPQLDQLDAHNARRGGTVSVLLDQTRDLAGLQSFANRVDGSPGYYKVGFVHDESASGLSRERLTAAVRAEGVALEEGFTAAHVGRSPSRMRPAGPLAGAERLHHAAVVLHHPILLGSDEEVSQVAIALRKVLSHAERLR